MDATPAASSIAALASVAGDVPLFIGGEWKAAARKINVRHPYGQRVLWAASEASVADVAQAVASAENATATMAQMPAHRRARILGRTVELLQASREKLAARITLECGKPIRLARAEVDRCLQTFTFAADEARHIGGDVIPLDGQAEGERRLAFTVRQPIGVIGAITPFNFPLNLVAHKVAPAIAAGNTVVLKPSPLTPATAAALVELLLQGGLPPEAIQLVHGGAEVGEALVTDARVAMITFTGGTQAGQAIQQRAGMKRVTLELGSNAAVIIDGDADLGKAVPRCVAGAFHYSGQSCISLQRIFVHRARYDDFVGQFVAAAEKLRLGDPCDEATDVGPLISEAAAQRVEQWIQEAVDREGKVLCGGVRHGSAFAPTLLAEVGPGCTIAACEAFGPVALVWPFDDFKQAVAAANDSRYGLNAGVFTRDVERAFAAALALKVGSVLINDIPTFRVEHMPYGGVKESGTGREGVKYAIAEMTQEKLIIFNLA